MKTFNDIIVDHPDLDLRGYDGYDRKSIGREDDDLMKVVYNTPTSPLLDLLHPSNNLMTFEEIFVSSMDEEKDH